MTTLLPPVPLPCPADPAAPPTVTTDSLLRSFEKLPARELRSLEARLGAATRELGLSTAPGDNDAPWRCDLLPHVFPAREWSLLVRGATQRLRAYEMFLQDIYGKMEILRESRLPAAPVLGSPLYSKTASLLNPGPGGHQLHLCGLNLVRERSGAWLVRSHSFHRASGLAYMMLNRRVISRVAPEVLYESNVEPVAHLPLALLDHLRSVRPESAPPDPVVVLLTPGPVSPTYAEHTFLARRMGIPMVQGKELLVLKNSLFLKTVQGLQKVDVIYSRVAAHWLDPLVFRRDSTFGVPGLVHCLRERTVTLVNSIGSQLADDRALLAFAPAIIRFYLGENPILKSHPTAWCGDLDQREMVLANLDAYDIFTLNGDRPLGNTRGDTHTERERKTIAAALRRDPSNHVAQPRRDTEQAVCFENGKKIPRFQDHVLFALRHGHDFHILPGALTRVSGPRSRFPDPALGGGSKDAWIIATPDPDPDAPTTATAPELRRPDTEPAPSPVTRRTTSLEAEGFYWLGRYLERAGNLAILLSAIESLETEELSITERKIYRPVWNSLLPPLDTPAAPRNTRSLGSPRARYALLLQPDAFGSVLNSFHSALANAETVRENLSPEAWASLMETRDLLARHRFQPRLSIARAADITRATAGPLTRLIPQFFAVANDSLLHDDGWRFCLLGRNLERAVSTGNAISGIAESLREQLLRPPSLRNRTEIELSAFLRLVGTRDAHRRVYQVRAEPVSVLQLLWSHPQVSRSVTHCLQRGLALLDESGADHAVRSQDALRALIRKLQFIDWSHYFQSPPLELPEPERQRQRETRAALLGDLLQSLLRETMNLHHAISDSFLNHQELISSVD